MFIWYHQAWEESLDRFGVNAESVFPGGRNQKPTISLPIVHCHGDFYSPLRVGDLLTIRLNPQRLDHHSFEVLSEIFLSSHKVASSCLRHVAINSNSRQRCVLPDEIERWLEASSLSRIQPL